MKNLNRTVLSSVISIFTLTAFATDYHVGPNQSLVAIADVPWTILQAGDRVYIYWSSSPYKEKWVINRQGTPTNPIKIIGVNGPQDQQPIIDGDGAVTPSGLDYWNENRGVIKIGGSGIPSDGLPSHIIIENLEIRSARPPYQFTNDQGQIETYVDNAASIYVEKAAHLTIRNCKLHDSGNGLFIGAFGGQTEDILIENNHIYDNGIVGSFYQHNTYTEATDITYQFNHFGALRDGADGNNLKDRSAGLVVRYNWIEGGNRQLDLVDATGAEALINHPGYATTRVYGNILIEPDGAGNSQIAHYGGDSGNLDDYRKGDLYFYNNTVISTRSGNTTLLRLSSNDETAHVFNNVVYTTAGGNHLAMISGDGTFNLHHNWLNSGWQDCHCIPNGTVIDLGNNQTGTDPLFADINNQDFRPQSNSSLIGQGDVIPALLLPEHDVVQEYVEHQLSTVRQVSGNIDVGAFEYLSPVSVDEVSGTDLLVYPNPVSDLLTINAPRGSIELYAVYNGLGQAVSSGTGYRINVSDLAAGVYWLEITGSDSGKSYHRIVKR